MPALRIQLRTSLSRNSRTLLKPAPHAPEVLSLDVRVIRVEDGPSRYEHQVNRQLRGRSFSPEDFPQQPLRAVSLDRAPDLPAGDEPHAQPAPRRHENEGYEHT